MTTPAYTVEGTGPIRSGLPYGLFSVVSLSTPTDSHWEGGIQWDPLGCDPVNGIGEPGVEGGVTTATGLPKTGDREPGPDYASAFSVYALWEGSSLGHSMQDAQDRATSRLLAREEARVEQALWTGDLGNTPHLAAGAGVTIVESGVNKPTHAIGALEGFLATEYGSVGVLHMDRATAVSLLAEDLLETHNGRLHTVLGTPVVAGAGYPGSGPNGEAPHKTKRWVYATPALMGFRSDLFFSTKLPYDLLDRSQNDLFAIAERKYTIGFDSCAGIGTVEVEIP